MQQKLEADDINTEFITLTLEEYNRNKINSDEIRIDGNLFDIKSLEEKNGNVFIKCLRDNDEEFILKEIKQLLCISGDEGSSPPPQIQQFFSLDYTLPCSGLLFLVPVSNQTFQQVTPASLMAGIKDICSPPPETV